MILDGTGCRASGIGTLMDNLPVFVTLTLIYFSPACGSTLVAILSQRLEPRKADSTLLSSFYQKQHFGIVKLGLNIARTAPGLGGHVEARW